MSALEQRASGRLAVLSSHIGNSRSDEVRPTAQPCSTAYRHPEHFRHAATPLPASVIALERMLDLKTNALRPRVFPCRP